MTRKRVEESMPVNAVAVHAGDNLTLEPLLKVEEVANILGRTHWTIRQDIRAGRLRAIRIGRRIMIEPAEVRRVIEEGRSQFLNNVAPAAVAGVNPGQKETNMHTTANEPATPVRARRQA